MKKFNIVYEDKKIIVINKEAKLLTIATKKEKERTLYHQVREYIKKQNPHNKIFIVHRLDKDTSGIIIFAKSESIKKELQDNWSNITRKYYAIVEGIPDKKEDTITTYLEENYKLEVIPSNNPKKGKKSLTSYKIIKTNKKYSLLEITLITGRKNQIRASFSFIGHPIIGDKKYKSKTNPINRLGLHAYFIKYNNQEFETPIPKEFNSLFK